MQENKVTTQQTGKPSTEQASPLLGKSLEELNELKARYLQRKTALETIKKAKKVLNTEQQAELNSIAMALVDVNEAIDEFTLNGPEVKAEENAEKSAPEKYVPAKGTENMVHLRIVRGRRFNPNTGVEESPAYVQRFTLGEWNAFKAHHTSLGYSILEVLHDPYNEAAAYVK